ncbi:hypothetical protein D3C80_1809840 [compost metagenome]
MPSVSLAETPRLNQLAPARPDSPALPLWLSWVPVPRERNGRRPAPPSLRVKIWITPPMASEPYRLERGPRTISMRSISSTGRSWKAALPLVAEPTLMPSISTST